MTNSQTTFAYCVLCHFAMNTSTDSIWSSESVALQERDRLNEQHSEGPRFYTVTKYHLDRSDGEDEPWAIEANKKVFCD